MTRKIKEFFLKYFKSEFLWKFVIFGAIIFNYLIRLFRIVRIFGLEFGPPKVWNKSTKKWIEIYNNSAQKKAIYTSIYPAQKIISKPAKTLDKDIHPMLVRYINESQYEQFVAEIPHGKIVGTYTNMTPDNHILWDSSWYLSENIYTNPYTYKINLGKFKKEHHNVALLSSNDTFKNYFHWMMYALPKFHLFQKSGFRIDKFATDYSPANKESLDALGLSSDQLIITSPATRIEANNLIVASTPTLFGNAPKRAISFLKGTFLDTSKSNNNTKRRIYRSRITNRKVVNEVEVVKYLESLGFEKIIPDNLTIRQQAEIFSQAEVVVAPHGAGLTNLVFCNPGTKVIELFHEKTVWGHYYCLSNACDLDYGYLIGKSVRDNSKIAMDRDMIIPLDKLKQLIKIMKIS